MKATWAAVWPWLVVVAILGLAKVPTLYLLPVDTDAIATFENDSPEALRNE